MKTLKGAVEDYLELRRGLGFRLEKTGAVLKRFVFFMERKRARHLTIDLALQFATEPKTALPSHWAARLGILRRFALHWSATDPQTEVPPFGLLPHRYQRRHPYIYNGREIRRLVNAASKLPSKLGLRKHTYRTLFGLIAVTGLRISEVIGLDQEDVDFIQGVLKIRRTKFGKDRFVPIHCSTLKVLKGYARLRDRIHNKATTPSFFLSEQGTRLSKWAIRGNFIRLSKEIGLRAPQDRHGPRIHDLRHHFAIRTLIGWYRSGVNVDAHMALLSTYLGHCHATDTYWYLSAAPELLGLAASRLEKEMGGVR